MARAFSPLRVLIADDSEPVRRLLAQTVACLEGVEVVGEAADGVEALAQVEGVRPDVLILDLHMPRLSGLKALRRLNEIVPGEVGERPAVIVLSNETAEVYRTACHEAGALHVFDKTTEMDLVESALLSMARRQALAWHASDRP